jgi:shikimate dehydrogenase
MDTTAITNDTQLCISLAGRPSRIGTRFHNWLYGQLELDFVYKACTTEDIAAAIAGVRALGIRGCGVSMPFKQDVIPLVDVVDSSAAAIGAVNTIVNTAGRLAAYNTDYLAVAALLQPLPREAAFAVLGSGGMARAIVAALHDAGFAAGTVVARNRATGAALAEQYGFAWRPDIGDERPSLVINATPIGMAGGADAEQVPVSAAVVATAETIFDVVAFPAETPLVRLARSTGRRVITGAEVLALQAAEQFALYTGVRPSPDLVARASAFSRSA